MLKQRILTAVPLVIAGLGLILYLPTDYFAIVAVLILLLCAWEWAALIGAQSIVRKGLFVAVCGLIFIYLLILQRPVSAEAVVLIDIVVWIVLALSLLFYKQRDAAQAASRRQPLHAAVAPVVLGGALCAAVWLHGFEPLALLFAVAVTAAADVGAYFVGKRFGRHKLAPELSPGKTVEGLLGGVAAALLVAGIFSFILAGRSPTGAWLYPAALLLALFSVVGDLFFSMLKRESGLKDSSGLLPGHGGLLDRLDGHLAVLPVWSLMLYYVIRAGG